jgi:hypothetical protein
MSVKLQYPLVNAIPQYSDLLKNNPTYGYLTYRQYSPAGLNNKYQNQTPYRNYNPIDTTMFNKTYVNPNLPKKKNTFALSGSQYVRQQRANAVGNADIFDSASYNPTLVYTVTKHLRAKGCVVPKKCTAIQNPFKSGVSPLGSYISTPNYNYSRY